MSVQVQTGDTEPIQAFVLDANAAPLAGLSDLFVRLRRASDGFYLDWADMTFKSTGWTTLNQPLVEQDAANAAGVYEVTGGLDTSALVNPVVDDTYTVIPLQTPGTNAVLPSPENINVGRWADAIGAVGTVAYVSVIATNATPATVKVLAWLERDGQRVTAGLVSASITFKEPDGTVVFGPSAMTGPNADGAYRLDVASVTLVDVTNYYAVITVTDAVGAVTNHHANPSLGG